LRFFSFSLLIGGGALLAHLFLYARVLRPLLRGRRPRRVALAFLTVMTGLLVFRGTVRGLGPSVARVHDVVAYGWVSIALAVTLVAVVGDLVRLALWLASRVAPARLRPPAGVDEDAAPRIERRRVLQAIPPVVLAGGGGLAMYGTYRAFTAPEVTEVVVPIPRLPRVLDGLSIVQLTDVHVGSFIGRRFVDMLVESANAQRPDLVVVTGDLVDGDVPDLGDAVAALAGLRSRFGTFFVTGNHEYYSGELPWIDFLRGLGVRVLRNERVSIGDEGGVVDLIGVDDWSGARRRGGQGYDLEAALVGRDPERAAILLAHQPENFEVAAGRGVDLQISGHTHGGQLFPFSRLTHLRYRHHRGHYRHEGSHLYVSRGCGFWGPPSRIDAPPEIARIVLARG
jgi:predicted MPP superfamily phosphohydrolase